jgi:hypothetical protein
MPAACRVPTVSINTVLLVKAIFCSNRYFLHSKIYTFGSVAARRGPSLGQKGGSKSRAKKGGPKSRAKKEGPKSKPKLRPKASS